ncbi:MAG: TlpA family protein disulfide reductase [Ardenticatenaceae bacterium]|nr:TlpA family protein disulfide reductase [Ardenticatenaceae bacterium]HBY97074.1 TlpA family protein disulfide reductase [Chloroflexota bacterium]
MEGVAVPPKSSPWLIVIALVAVLGSAWIFVSRVPDGADAVSRVAPQAGFQAPDFTLDRLGGGQTALADVQGQAVLLNFWATWCPPCRAEMPAIQRVANEYTADGLAVLLVNQGEEPGTISRYLDSIGVTAPVVLDRDGAVGLEYRVRALPTTFFIDREGIIRDVTIGGPMSEAFLRSRIEPLLGKP